GRPYVYTDCYHMLWIKPSEGNRRFGQSALQKELGTTKTGSRLLSPETDQTPLS
ncbi:hypothetical protein ACJMK2_037349, partial [Sinanodonta woodiana]